MKKAVLTVLRFYQRWISPMFYGGCRFHPSCSCYAVDAVNKYGVLRGLGMTCRRVMKCHPFHCGGYDPVP